MNREGQEAGPISIKTAKWGCCIALGDARRQLGINRNFTLVVGFWQPRRKKKRIVRVVVTNVTAEVWQNLWGKLTSSDLERIAGVVTDRSLRYETVRVRAKEEKAKMADKGSLIVLNPKIDSKK
jgi:hypothetical protein